MFALGHLDEVVYPAISADFFYWHSTKCSKCLTPDTRCACLSKIADTGTRTPLVSSLKYTHKK